MSSFLWFECNPELRELESRAIDKDLQKMDSSNDVQDTNKQTPDEMKKSEVSEERKSVVITPDCHPTNENHHGRMEELENKYEEMSSNLTLILERLRTERESSELQLWLLGKGVESLKDEAKEKYRILEAVVEDTVKSGGESTTSLTTEMLFSAKKRTLDELESQEDPRMPLAYIEEQIETLTQQITSRDHQLLVNLKEEVDELKSLHISRRLEGQQPEDSSEAREVWLLNSHRMPTEQYKDETDVSNTKHDDSDNDGLKDNDDEYEHYFMPNDTYSYFAVADYVNSGIPTTAFLLIFFICSIQILTLWMFVLDVVDFNNPDDIISVPPGVSIAVRMSQLLALLLSCWNQDEIRASINVLALGYNEKKVRAINGSATRWKWYFSAIVRLFLGCLILVITFFLVVKSDSVRDVMLDFAAVTFVSELDDGAFVLAHWGYMGKDIQQLAVRIKDMPVYEKKTPDKKRRLLKIPRLVSLLVVIGLVCGFWGFVTYRQAIGYYVDQTIFVQFGDDFSPVLGGFSGLYELELDDTNDGMRVTYVTVSDEKNARFSYCLPQSRWIFRFDENLEAEKDDICWSDARSATTSYFDITKTSGQTWYVKDDELSLDLPLQHFLVKGQNDYYGKSCRSDIDCGDRLYCKYEENVNGGINQCVCRDGLFGMNCEFQEPCQSLEIDPRDPNGFFGTRTWSRKYHSVQKGDETNRPIQVYGKPIYVGDESKEGALDLMIFTGRRWILTDSAHIDEYDSLSSDLSERHLAEFLADNFHAYWSNYSFYFVSEAVDVGTPIDSATPLGLNWYHLGTRGARLHSGKKIWQDKIRIEAKLFCAHCDDETNPCFFGGTCNSDNTCTCTTGSSGTLCQIPPDGNGLCDAFFNTLEFDFDGGDCCEESCISTEDYACGRAYINTGGVSAYGFVGYENCRDPRFSSKLSGSRTLFQIVERGTVRCGLGIFDGWMTENDDGSFSGFEVDLCKAIAGAALSDPEAIEIVETTWPTRWDDFIADKFDVLLIPTTHTADRDVYQIDAELGFTFASHCYLFDGLMFGGIPQFTQCADNVEYDSVDCQELKICSVASTTWNNKVQELFPANKIVVVDSVSAMYEALEAGHCNVITGELTNLAEFIVRGGGFTGPEYEIGSKTFSKEPMAAVTQQNDGVWSKFVSWTFHALIQAEESGITQSTAEKLAPTEVFGDQFRYMFRNAVAASGNFGEIFHNHFEAKLPRTGLNDLNNGTTGLMYGFPFGSYQNEGPEPIFGGSMDTIRKRGSLNCGFLTAPGFAELDLASNSWKGFSVDICRGIAAALLGGSPNVNFVSLNTAEWFEVLAAGTIDVLIGATRTLEREVKEASTGLGFDFAPPIFYDGLAFAGSPIPARCADELDFGSKNPECSNTKICVPEGTTWLNEMRGRLGIPEANILVTKLSEESYQRLNSGECNAVAGETVNIAKSTVQQHGWPADEEYYVGVKKHTKEPLGIVSRSNDAQFSDFLRWIFHALVYAEEHAITRDDYFDMPIGNNLFGGALSAMWQHAIAVVGNYGEIFERNFEGILERSGQNKLNNNGGPQVFALPGVVVNV